MSRLLRSGLTLLGFLAPVVACSGFSLRADGDGGAIVFATDGGDAGPGALTSNPGAISCGQATCTGALGTPLDGQDRPLCCAFGSSSGPGSAVKDTCVSSMGACSSGVAFYCDETNDCVAGLGLVCCEGTGREAFSCQPNCSGVRLCKSSVECAAGLPCTAYRCDGQTIGVCGVLSDAKRKALGC